MRDTEVYKEAAEQIDSGIEEFSCNAIDRIAKRYYSQQRCNYEECFWNVEVDKYIKRLNWTALCRQAYKARVSPKDLRVMLLCMASAIVESDGKLPSYDD